MATSSISKFQCTTCIKAIGTLTCRGCGQNFCTIHAGEHRQMLSRQMDEDIIPLHDQIQQNINETNRSMGKRFNRKNSSCS